MGRAAEEYEQDVDTHRTGGVHHGICAGVFYGNVFCGNGHGCSASRFYRVAGIYRDDILHQYLVYGEVQEIVGYRYLLSARFDAYYERDFCLVAVAVNNS